ncbi:ATP-binding protein [Gramella sp. MAR_2010_147]|uniref:ATP-binding protein n=1 Tax=Gramella sp. MAR_2010_147 TaxID=1250205 RepID=UPI00087DF0C7|nr:ATP-binding protein [Gramella sp. MAR_2010_147]SDR70716.1 Bacteriophytochrome (light-regulated signal transduction histidine kinase) [Gramella sp. MAR_2010_147]
MAEHNRYPERVDLSSCEKEPIHIIGSTQSYGVVIACDKFTGRIIQIGENCKEFFNVPAEDLLGKELDVILGVELSRKILSAVFEDHAFKVEETCINDKEFVVIPHVNSTNFILDIEPISAKADNFDFQKGLSSLLNTLSVSQDAEELCRDAAKITKSIFGYDRVMIYKFDEEWNGQVIAEELNEEMESWLGLQYPASDIPKQARQLFLKNRVRIISDVNYSPVKIIPRLSPETNEPLDLTNSKLRGVSPIHIEYLQNMKVGASLTAALLSNGKLWGLLTCHHYQPKFINYYQRQTCEFLIQIFSNELSLKNSKSFISNIEKLDALTLELINQIHLEANINRGLRSSATKITDLLECGGAAIILNGKIKLVGKTPDKKDIKKLVRDFLAKKKESLFHTKQLQQFYPMAENFKESGSGILSLRLGQSESDFLIWFRPEVIKTVEWGGNPENKATYNEEKERLTPRKSFEKWTEQLTGISHPWQDFEISGARKLGESVSYVILENQKKEIDNLNKQLVDAHNELELFSQGLSHDLKAPLRGIDGYAHVLKEDHYTDLHKEGQMAVDTILSSAEKMRELIDNILSFAGVSNQDVHRNLNSPNTMIGEILVSFNLKSNYPKTEIIVEENMPKLVGDRRMLSQVWSNLITNALKYSEKNEKPRIEIGTRIHDRRTIYFVKDNGIGFDPKYKEEIFNLFSRHSGDDYQGTGIGLAIVKKIIEKHNGKIWAEAKEKSGSVFYFYV